MQHRIILTQTLVTVIKVDTVNEKKAEELGNWMLERDIIPLDKYQMIEATVKVEKNENIIPFPKEYISN